MKTDTAYHMAAVPEPVTALGKKLLPYSLGHRLLLEREKSCFVNGGEISFADLVYAIFICSNTFDGAIKALQSPLTYWRIKFWGFCVFLAVRFGGKNLAQSFAHFAEYVSAGSRPPVFSVKESDAEPIKCPEVSLVKVYLQSRLGYSNAEVMNLPWGQAMWEYSIHAALEGNCKLLDEETQSEIEEMMITPQETIDKWIAAARKESDV